MNNRKIVENMTTEWSANAQDESSTPKVLTAVEKMLHTSRLYLKVDQTKTEYDLSHPAKTDRLRGSPVVQ
jgi:hypothetical protein